MSEWLIKTFVRDYTNTEDASVRLASVRLAGIVGILCNLFLACVKLTAGVLSSSAAVISDAVNNLTDCISCIITMIGNRIASRPADAEHPFGHGRMEYIVSLVVTAIIFSAAFELLREGISRILHPVPLHISGWMPAILVLTIFVKFWMSRFNRKLGLRLNHTGLLATAKDSMNDMLATGGTIAALLCEQLFPSLPMDGIAASLVAVYIFYSGYEMAMDIIGKLLGDNADEELRKQVEETIREDAEVLGVHDLVIHDYGPGNRMGSAHVEMRPDLSLLEAHHIIDACEKRVQDAYHLGLTIHPDPLETDAQTAEWKNRITAILEKQNAGAAVHDFHLLKNGSEVVLQFDVNVSYDCPFTNEQLLDRIKAELDPTDHKIRYRVTFDRGHMSETRDG